MATLPFSAMPERLASIATNVSKAPTAAVEAVGLFGKKTLIETAAPYSVKGRNGKKLHLGARYNVIERGAAPKVLLEGTPARSATAASGPWSLIERGRKGPITEVPRKVTKQAARKGIIGKSVLRTPYGPRASVVIPAHGPFGHPWQDGIAIINVRAPIILRQETFKQVAKIVRV